MALEFKDQSEFEAAVANIVQPLMRATMKSTKKEIVDDVTSKIDGLGKTLGPQLEEMRTAIADGGKGGKKGKKPSEGDGEGADPPAAADPVVKTLQAQISALQKQNQQAEERRLAAERKQQSMTVNSRLRAVLEESGVTNPNKVRDLTARLLHEGKVRWSEGMEDAAYVDTDNEDLDLATGIKGLLTSDEGDYYKDPSGAAGAGTRPRSGKKPPEQQAGPTTEAELGMQLLRSINGLPTVGG